MQHREEMIKQLQNIQDPYVLQQQRQIDAKRKYEQLLAQVNLIYDEDAKDHQYTVDFQRFIHFYKFLARRPDSEQSNQSIVNRLQLWVPDTIVLNDREMPNYWLYSDSRGYVFRTDAFTSKNVVSKLANYTSPDELVAVVKKQQFRNMELVGNEIKLVCCRDLQTQINANFSNRMDLTVIQKFVKSNGPKAFICRTIWRKDRNPFCYIVTNKDDYFSQTTNPKAEFTKYITNVSQQNSCTIVNTCRGKYVDETVPYVKNILNYINIHLHITFKEFAADFIKDESGIWWFVNVKGFIIDKSPEKILWKSITHYGEDINEEGQPTIQSQQQISIISPKNKTKVADMCQKQKICKYCEQSYPEQYLQYKMTLKMIIQTDKHLYWRGKTFNWIERSDVTNLEVSNLYHEHKVCKQCYTLYKETEQLIELQLQFNKQLGLPSDYDTINQMLTLKANQVNNESIKTGLDESKQIFNISATKQLILNNQQIPMIHNTVIKTLNRFRFMILIHSIRDVPQNVDLSKHYYIECNIFDQKFKIKLDLLTGQLFDKGYFLTLNRMRLYYFFSDQRKGWVEYVNQLKVLPMYLYQENTKIGTLEIELQDLLSERVIRREFLKVFSVKDCYPILSWSLNLTLGLVDSGPANVTRIKLQEHFGVQLPNPDYCTCEPLPAEWMTILNQKKDLDIHRSERQITNHTLKRVSTAHAKLQKSRFEASSLHQDMESFNDSTKELYSQLNLKKEIQLYEIDEDERKNKKRRLFQQYDL
ncbi:unnamed protein product (macronuclear) [Paramecium tetraurelia]|uniref:DUSP domain-containing protein n=1 Tax=Paramecium tetraurelia TaxID=5888 RepID=A0DJE6_PARTE|nr:uncharacterized protein GSPATT00017507001 [Paramecium tetraurelia]CAK83163.1 unnamed protein product [Paramecium tetraurelia]|eukprot:XP_001450560.1 hypothetical protein (macronuclear) [Paramecium tetraurelia strain d4-2]